MSTAWERKPKKQKISKVKTAVTEVKQLVAGIKVPVNIEDILLFILD
jgi:hypothetical protein